MFYDFSVLPLATDHFDERVADICHSVKTGTYTFPIFSMTLVPEGEPVWDKATKMTGAFVRYRDALAKEGIPAAILVQASLGHGYNITPAPFSRYVNLTDGKEEFVYCPEDEEFLAHFQGVLRTLATASPAAIMLDDDFRLMMRPGHGCACPRHMAEFNRRAGTNMTREELFSHLQAHSIYDPLAKIFAETQRDSLIKAAKAFRAAIDEIDPKIQGVNCTSGQICESVTDTNKIFAGKGNPTMVRIPNGVYAPYALRGLSAWMAQTAITAKKLRTGGIDVILAETDTIPFNRYAKSARYLHTQYAFAVLEGLTGAKHWLTRMTAYEPTSGLAYRRILTENRGLYTRLASLVQGIKWMGVASGFIEQTALPLGSDIIWMSDFHSHAFITKNIEEMGIPFYFSDESEQALFLEGSIVKDMAEGEIERAFAGSLFLDGEAAYLLASRGYGHLLGVSVAEWDGRLRHGETVGEDGSVCFTGQKNPYLLTVENDKTEVLSYNYKRVDGGIEHLSPAVTRLCRPNGRYTVVFCGTPDAAFNYMEGFSFLNESRKHQLVGLLKDAGALPAYAVGDDEICMRAGRLRDGRLLVVLLPIGVDGGESICLYLESAPGRIARLSSSGEEKEVLFTQTAENEYCLQEKMEAMLPIFLLVE